jgi:septum site-determining protein MinC
VAVQGGSTVQTEAARAAGLVEAMDAAPPPESAPAPATPEPAAQEAPAAAAAPARATLVVDKPLRSGQRIYARGGDLVVLAMVSFGAEVIADGHIHVYAPLRGRAMAGARGDTTARIFSTCMEPQLVSVAGMYRTTENPLPPEVLGQAAQVRLEGERLLIEHLG